MNFISNGTQRRWLVVAVAIAAACGPEKTDLSVCENGKCFDTARPFCDVEGEYPASQGVENTCIPEPARLFCSDTEDTCLEGTLTRCVEGELPLEFGCRHGCNDDESHCRNVSSSNNLQGFMEMAFLGPDVDFDEDLIINTDTNEIIESGVVVSDIPTFSIPPENNSGVGILVLVVRSWKSKDVELQGESAVAILSDGDVLIEQAIKVGNAGNWDDSSCAPVWEPDDCTHNGQSAGGQGNGGQGGEGSGSYVGSLVHGSTRVEPLVGGCGSNSAGAIQITSNTFIEVIGRIEAMGGAGLSADDVCGTQYGHASGGGAGGSVLLEAPQVSLYSGISANGGSGACHKIDGSPGAFSMGAVTGPGCSSAGNRAGNGGNWTLNGGNGVPMGGEPAGSGGGAAGRVRINVLEGGLSMQPGAIISPTEIIGRLDIE